MGHHTLSIKGIHPYSIAQTYWTRSNTTLASAPEPYKNRFNKIAIQATAQMTAEKEAVGLLRVPIHVQCGAW